MAVPSIANATVPAEGPEVVFSRTLAGATTRNTHVERDFGFEAIRKLKAGIGARHHRHSDPPYNGSRTP